LERKKKLIETQYRNAKRLGSGRVDPMLMITEVCRYMGWDYWTYLKQPNWFIDLVLIKQKVNAEFAEIQAKKLKSK